MFTGGFHNIGVDQKQKPLLKIYGGKVLGTVSKKLDFFSSW